MEVQAGAEWEWLRAARAAAAIAAPWWAKEGAPPQVVRPRWLPGGVWGPEAGERERKVGSLAAPNHNAWCRRSMLCLLVCPSLLRLVHGEKEAGSCSHSLMSRKLGLQLPQWGKPQALQKNRAPTFPLACGLDGGCAKKQRGMGKQRRHVNGVKGRHLVHTS